jgi:transposase-like protein
MEVTQLVSRFGSESKCRAYLEQLRWPDGVRCPRCEASRGISRIETRGQFDCDACGYQFSVRVGTVLQASHLPLWKWFLAVYLMGESDGGVSAEQLGRTLGVSHKTAWYLCHRIRAAMKGEALGAVSANAVGAPLRHVSTKHLAAYLDERAFLSNNQDNAYRFRDLLLRLIGSGSIPYAELIASA